MSNRDKRNWLIFTFASMIFAAGYVYGRAAVLEEYKYEINKFSDMVNYVYDELCTYPASFSGKK